ncbi:helix-turn-helix domain-containing protein [Streptococcus sanguinis]|uniref:helix-turn-helix domain-containing protein n=1 Tax=Streptococcus sanguinis TaxID=1305 RepID=UPI000F65D6F0|nr:helix-turn-helix domain-containing protein [Streptococcus sanguinis]RSI39922.1 hypothetical protein D8875_05915 [Streptococcus sanguinis]
MLITVEIAEKIRAKRGKLSLTKSQTATALGIARSTLCKIESGNYKAPKRIYEAVMNWLVEDL